MASVRWLGMAPSVGRIIALIVAAFLAALVLAGSLQYPLPRWPLVAALTAYGAGLWYRPGVFLLVLPIVLPAWDCGLWTGWTMIGEADLFMATTVAVLLVQRPPATGDFAVRSIAGVVLGTVTVCWLVATLVGLLSPLGAPYSDNFLLRPDNALRITKSLIEALALLPFLRQRQRLHADAITWLGWGFAAGLVAVTLVVLAERLLFASFLDFSTAYRVAGPFSSMRVGGGHIGAYATLAMPFALALFQLRPRWLARAAVLFVCLCGGYTLAVTFARTAYAAATGAMAIAGLGWMWSPNPHRPRSVAASVVPMILVLAILSAAAAFTGMHARFTDSARDFPLRQNNWEAGMAMRDPGILATLFGMGMGSYQRTMLMRSLVSRPTDLVLHRDAEGVYASIRIETQFYLGQKIILPETGPVRLRLRARAAGEQTILGVLLCDKVLLYSDNCRGVNTTLLGRDQWTVIDATIATDGLGGRAAYGLLQRPVELSFFGPAGQTVEIRDINLTDRAGGPALVNGDFMHGLDHWIFTDDSHLAWRMKNLYLMLLFETGVVGLGAFAVLAGLTFAGGIRMLRHGVLLGGPVAGAIAGFMVCGLFDNLLEAPRLMTLFFLVCWCGLIQWEAISVRSEVPPPAIPIPAPD